MVRPSPRKVRYSPRYRQTGDSVANDEQGTEGAGQGAGALSTDRVIADMAKGFIEAQAKDESGGPANTEILNLLQKISSQLEKMESGNQQTKSASQTSQQTSSRQGEQQASSGQSLQQPSSGQNNQGAGQQGSSPEITQELRALFSQLLTGNEGSSNQSSGSSGSNSQGSSGGGTPQKSVTAQTAAQALSQAQYELAQELDNSLQKLRQVINESEKLANRITNLLEKDNQA